MTFGHEGGYAFNDDQRGGHTPSTTKGKAMAKPQPPVEAKPKGTIVSDPEGKALHALLKILTGLDAPVRCRVLRYLNSRFDDSAPEEKNDQSGSWTDPA